MTNIAIEDVLEVNMSERYLKSTCSQTNGLENQCQITLEKGIACHSDPEKVISSAGAHIWMTDG